MSVSRALFIGTLQLAVARWIVRSMGLISTVVLARLLVPDDFGLVAVATAYYGFIEAFSAFGIPQALIREKENASNLYSTAFTIYALRGLLLAVFGVAGAFAIPEFVNDSRLSNVLLVTSLRPLIDGLGNPRLMELERALNFRAVTIRQIGGKIIGVVVSIYLAVVTNSYWSMIAGLLSATLFETASGYVLLPWRPRFSLSGWRRLLSLSGWVSAANIVISIGQRLDNLIVAAFLDLKTTGIYNIGKEISSMPLGEIVSPMVRTLFPGLVRFSDTRAKLIENSLQALGVLTTCSLAIGCGFAFIGHEIIQMLYGSNWSSASVVVPYVSISLALETATSVAGSVVLAVGEVRLMFIRALSRTLFRLPIFIIGAAYWGLDGAAIGFAVGAVVTAAANIGILMHILAVGWGAVLRQVSRPVVASVFMSIGIWFLGSVLPAPTSVMETALDVLIKTVFGGFFYSLIIILTWMAVGRPVGCESRIVEEIRFRLRG